MPVCDGCCLCVVLEGPCGRSLFLGYCFDAPARLSVCARVSFGQVHCFHHGVNCILADEMGLGKTLQTIAFLTHVTLGPEPRAGGPHLVIVPLSVLTSWVLEFRRFSPHLRVVRLHSGDEKERERLRREVLADVTGYDVVRETLGGGGGGARGSSL